MVSRRNFLSSLIATGATGAAAKSSPEKVTRAWVIMALGWEHNDEYTYSDGEYVHMKLYLDKGLADAECKRLCDEFFAAQTPEDFEVDFEGYGLEGDPETLTWAEVREAGFPDPYYVLEMQT